MTFGTSLISSNIELESFLALLVLYLNCSLYTRSKLRKWKFYFYFSKQKSSRPILADDLPSNRNQPELFT
jgi:hypothetical protein